MAVELDTKQKILSAAEKLFADEGFSNTSLRSIVREAGVNVAAIHYHFGSKEALIEAVLSRRAAPVNEERLRLLAELERNHPEEPLPLEGIIEAFIGPVIRLRSEGGEGWDTFPRLLGRALHETDEAMCAIVHRIFGDVIERFVQVLKNSLPELPQEELICRIHFMVGAAAFAMFVPVDHILEDLGKTRTPRDRELLIGRLVRFLAAGMRAPIEGDRP